MAHTRDVPEDLPASTMDQAIRWWVLLHCEGASAADHREFGEWVALSPERVAAYLHVARLMRGLKSGSVKWPDTPAETLIREAKAATAEVVPLSRITAQRTAAREEEATQPAEPLVTVRDESRAPKGKYWQAAAVALLGIFIVAWYLVLANPVYRTAVGEQRSVLLDDGSRVTLNTDSTVEVRFRNDRRLVRLPKGEALFEVAHDASRPFDVQVGATIFRAIGTQFNVDKRDDHTTVTVVDGKVAVVSRAQLADQRSSPAAPFEGTSSANADIPHAHATVLSAADRMVISTSGTKTLSRLADPSIATAWLKRQLIFDNRPLSEVAEELNRYNHERIVIEGDELRGQAISGVIQLNDPAAFLAFIGGIPGVEIAKSGEGVYIVTLDEGPHRTP